MGIGERFAHLVQTMYWTEPIAIFFVAIAVMLVAMTGLQLVWPTTSRRGFLPMSTTRGERLFIGLLGAAWIHVLWLALLTLPLWYGSIVAILWMALILILG